MPSRPRWGHAAIAAGLVESASPWGGGGIAGGAEDTSGTVQRLGLWHAAMMLGRHDPTFWDDLEAMRHDVLVAGSTLAERSRALLWAGGVRETDMNLVMLSVLEEVMERAAASPSRGPPVLLASADEHWSPESNRQGLSDTAGDRAGVAVLGSTLLLTTGAVAAPAVVAVYRSASAVAMLRNAAAVKQVAETTTVIGRVKDLQRLGPGEKSLLDRLPNLGSPRANWRQNSSVLRQEMRRGKPIRDASPSDATGQFLNAERNLLLDRGWTFDRATNYWMPPKP